MPRFLRVLYCAAAALALLGSFAQSHAQGFPSKPITVVVPAPPGGSVDLTARAVTTAMSRIMGQPFTIEYRPGGAGGIAHQYVARAAPDGYTLVASAIGGFILAPRLAAQRAFTVDDFEAVGMMAVTPMVLVVPPGSRFKDFNDLINFAKANPDKLNFGHPGAGTTNHVAVVRLMQALGTTFNLVSYKGAAPALTDLAGGQIDGYIDQIPSSLSFITNGRLRPLAVTTAFRSSSLPETPTFLEAGLKNLEMSTTMGLLAPAKTPEQVVSALNRALNQALGETDLQTRLATLGSVPQPMSPADYARYLKSEDAKAEELSRQGILKAQ